MRFDELEINKKYYVKRINTDISYVTVINREFFETNLMVSYLFHTPLFFITGYGTKEVRPIDEEMWVGLFENVREVTWSSVADCPEMLL